MSGDMVYEIFYERAYADGSIVQLHDFIEVGQWTKPKARETAIKIIKEQEAINHNKVHRVISAKRIR